MAERIFSMSRRIQKDSYSSNILDLNTFRVDQSTILSKIEPFWLLDQSLYVMDPKYKVLDLKIIER